MAPLSVVVQPNTPPGQAPLNNPPVSHAPAAVIAPPLAGNSPRNSAERSSTADFGDVRAAPRAQAAPLQRAIGSSASSSEHTSGSRSHVATSSVDSSVGASSAIGRSSGSGSGSDRSSKDSLEAIGHEAIVRTLTRVPSNAGLRKAAEVTKATPVTVSPKQFASPGQTGATPSIVGRARASLESAASTGASASSGPMPRSGSISSVAPSQNQRWSNGSESSLMSSQSVQPGPAAARLRSGSSTNAPSAASRAALLAQQTSPNLGGPTSASGHGSFPQRPGLKTSVSASGAVSGTFTTAADGHAGGPGDSPVRTMSEAGHGFSGSLQGHGKRRTESAGNGYISASASTSGHGYGYGNGYGYGSSLGRRASVSSLSSRRTEMEEDRVLHGVSPSLRLDRLRRTETRFTGAFGGELCGDGLTSTFSVFGSALA